MKRITRERKLKLVAVEKYRAIRKQIAQELPKLVLRHHERMETREQLEKLCEQLKTAREERGLSLTDLTRITGMDRSALSKLENGKRSNPTVDTLARYAEAVGKRVVVRLDDTHEE